MREWTTVMSFLLFLPKNLRKPSVSYFHTDVVGINELHSYIILQRM
jgi:hypothetical protein